MNKKVTAYVEQRVCGMFCSHDKGFSCDALKDGKDKSCNGCAVKKYVEAFNDGMEYERKNPHSPFIDVKDDLPYKHNSLLDGRGFTFDVFVRFDDGKIGTAYMEANINTKGDVYWSWNKSGVVAWFAIVNETLLTSK